MKKAWNKAINNWEDKCHTEADWMRKHMFLGIFLLGGYIVLKTIQIELISEGIASKLTKHFEEKENAITPYDEEEDETF